MPTARDWRAVAVPAAISLCVTLLRLTGERLGWDPALFDKQPGGGGALVGIAWLVLPFGAWFGWQLVREGQPPRGYARAFGLAAASLLLLPALGVVAGRLFARGSKGELLFFCAACLPGLVIAWTGWPALGRRLLAYALLARVPVMVVMLLAMLGNWGTHYDATSESFASLPPFVKWLWMGVLPQMTVWLWFTLAVGGLLGVPAARIAARRGVAPAVV